MALLRVDGLHIGIGGLKLVDGVSFELAAGEMLGLVGESGCGKTLTALSLMRLLPQAQGLSVEGRISFEGRDVLALSPEELRRLRGNRMAMIFQEPMTSLNPVFSIGDQVSEAISLHHHLPRAARQARMLELLDLVGIPAPSRVAAGYPHEISGGQRQRVMIAMALACEPSLLIADEPTTALDVTVQAQILDLIDGLRHRLGMAVLLITHDLGVVAECCDRVAIMYAGRVVESGQTAEILDHPRHRYTEALIRTVPANNPPGTALPSIPGLVPPPSPSRWQGCAFAGRCQATVPRCAAECPGLESDRPTPDRHGRLLRCFNPAAELSLST
ncbi:peptide/nickel transport system ATP-binding protein [Rhizobiales bacterium GAS191]|nr:peptide/nickel transport system ATP-binding protein [Rhizobiales bacterium GAS113]SEC95749.1 peptide/nickel transport system ATP-binding protein [Rhizobiales bacterium GAS191]